MSAGKDELPVNEPVTHEQYMLVLVNNYKFPLVDIEALDAYGE